MRPIFGTVPNEYDKDYFRTMVLQLNVYLERLEAVREGRFNGVNISQLPTSATGLRSGDVWNDGGTLKIVS